MIHLSLPYFYENADFYARVNDLLYKYRNNFQVLNKNFNIEFAYGAFPFSFWNGGINSNYNPSDKLPIYTDYLHFLDLNVILISLDISNNNIIKTDVYDRHLNAILDLFKDNGTYLEVSNYWLAEAIKEKYPNYKFILSKNTLMQEKDFNNEIFELIQIIPSKISYEFLSNLQNKNQYQIVIGLKNNYLENIDKEQLYQISFSNQTCFNDCKAINSIDLFDEINIFYKLGFTHFIIDAPPLCELNYFNKNLLNLLFTQDFLLTEEALQIND